MTQPANKRLVTEASLTDTTSPAGVAVSTAISRKAPNPRPLQKYRKKYALVRHGGGIARILCVGDSTTGGGNIGAGTFENQYAWPSRLAELFEIDLAIGANGLGLPPIGSSTDSRWTLGTGWSLNTGYGFGNSGVYTATNPAGSLKYKDARIIADRFDVYYHTAGGAGNLHITATGGTTADVVCNGATDVKKVTVSAATAVTTNDVTITADGGGLVNIVGVEPWRSAGSKVIIGNAGRNGTRAVEWGTDALNLASLAAIKRYAPDLTIISLAINDGNPSNLPPIATYKSNLNALFAAARVSGDVLVWIPFAQGLYESGVETYRKALREAAEAAGAPVIDMQERFGDFATAQPIWFRDLQHMGFEGHMDQALGIHAYLKSITS